MNICLFANENVGLEIVKIFMTKKFKLSFLVLDSKGDTKLNSQMLQISGLDKSKILYSDDISKNHNIQLLKNHNIDLAILAWWHYIIKEPLIDIAKFGFLNFHPSLLPYNRGKHYYVWNLIEDVPFGVTIHFIDAHIDSGDIVFQKEIETTFEDNGFSLREKSQVIIVELFNENFDNIIKGNLPRKKQNLKKGSFHLSNELESASIIDLNKKYYGYELLNLLRSRSGFQKGGCYFYYNDKKFEVSIKIKEI